MDDTPWLDAVEDRAWRGVRRLGLVALAEVNRDLQRQAALSEADYDVLSGLTESDGDHCRFRDLASRNGWSTSRLSHHLDRMQQRELITRIERTDDARGSDVVLTDLGRETIRAAAPDHVRSVRRNVFDHLTKEQVAQLASITEAILQHHETRST